MSIMRKPFHCFHHTYRHSPFSRNFGSSGIDATSLSLPPSSSPNVNEGADNLVLNSAQGRWIILPNTGSNKYPIDEKVKRGGSRLSRWRTARKSTGSIGRAAPLRS